MKEIGSENTIKEKEITLRVRVVECIVRNVIVKATNEFYAINKIADMYGDDFIEQV